MPLILFASFMCLIIQKKDESVKSILVQTQEQIVKNYFEMILHLFPHLSGGSQTESFDKYALCAKRIFEMIRLGT